MQLAISKADGTQSHHIENPMTNNRSQELLWAIEKWAWASAMKLRKSFLNIILQYNTYSTNMMYVGLRTELNTAWGVWRHRIDSKPQKW